MLLAVGVLWVTFEALWSGFGGIFPPESWPVWPSFVAQGLVSTAILGFGVLVSRRRVGWWKVVGQGIAGGAAAFIVFGVVVVTMISFWNP